MKNVMKTSAVVMLAVAMAMVGCKKEKVEPSSPGTPEVPVVENIFAGTSWLASVENSGTISEQGYNILFHVVYDASLDFIDTVNVEYYNSITVDYPGYPVPPQSYDMTYSSSYSYAGGDTVMMYLNWEDEETGETGVDTTVLVYDKQAKTLTLFIDDPESAEILDATELVFTQVNTAPAKTTVPAVKDTKGRISWQKLMRRVVRAMNER